MDKKEINSPKLTARFLIFMAGFVLVMLVVAHFLLRWF
jgi:preprotein translocase subunit Sec61beta